MLAVAAVTAVSVVGAGAPARAEPTDPGTARPEVPPTVGEETAVPEPPTELAEAPAEEAPSDNGQETVAAVVVEDGERSVVTVEAAPSEVDDVTEDLAEQPGVVDVFVDAPARAATLPDDSRVEEQWGLYELGLDAQNISWAAASAGSGELVAVLDSGVDDTHSDLDEGRVRCDLGADFTAPPAAEGDPFVSVGDGCEDPLGHGTHVAGTVGADWNNGIGVAGVSQAQILPVRVLDGQGWGTVAGISAGIFHAVDAGASVVNMSIVGDGLAGVSGYEEAVQHALDNGVVVVASAGNNRQEGNRPQYPAAVPGVLSVAATDYFGLSAEYSYRGPTNVISAPGTQILSTVPGGGYEEFSGTSMAAPHVAGIVAWYRELHPTATVAQIRNAVTSTAIDMEKTGKDDSTGFGMIDMGQLLTGTQVVPESSYDSTIPAAPLVTSVVPRDSGLFVTWQTPA